MIIKIEEKERVKVKEGGRADDDDGEFSKKVVSKVQNPNNLFPFPLPFPDITSLSPLSEAFIQKAVEEVKKNGIKELDGSISLGPSRDSEILDRIGEAFTQMTFYMASYRNNASYTLPSVLKPSEIQQSRAHDPLIDGTPIAGLRDGLIEFEGEFSAD